MDDVMKQIRYNWHRGAMLLILALTGFLSFYSIGNEGYANQYYSAAVRSMLSSWHNFFFASFDAGGFVTVDKPALGLWLQAISVLAFGWHGWSLILPEALSAVISSALMYCLVSRFFGKAAGVAAASILATTPVFIAVSRTNNLDSSLVMILLLAVWALLKALKKGGFGFLALSMALVGLGFNIKMLQAFMVLPAFYLVYLLTAPVKMKTRILQLSGATAILLVVSLSWALAVDLTPEDSRPYVGGSKTNSVLELAFEYNGIQRLIGRNGQLDGGFSGGRQQGAANDGRPGGRSGIAARNFSESPGGRPGNGMIGGGGPGGEGENGAPGVLRLFNEQLAGQISWLLPMGLFGMAALFLNVRKNGTKSKSYRYLLLWAGWLLPASVFFSMAGFFHRYYLTMLAPPIAALAGAGAVEMYRAYIRAGWKWVLFPSALPVTSIFQAVILFRYSEWHLPAVVLCVLCIFSAAALVGIRILRRDYLRNAIKLASIAGFAILLAAPAFWAATPLMYGSQTTLPIAGPELKRGGNGQPGGGFNDNLSANVEFLLSKKQGEKYLVAVQSANSAAPIIIETGEPVLAIGGFSGSDRILTVERLEQMVKAGELRYFEVGGRGMGQSEIIAWVTEHGKAVTGTSLYDLAPEKG